ncbi:lysylphosphatidylglycerol synthase domain-containing protein [Gangjinia marincola]|uniref:Lysylphosphatidylglycerol synthase domain-containing protein n=1 Tax=Gangjinia marincola TaxID=578463 RepID=A0ABP3XT33_9FLAO
MLKRKTTQFFFGAIKLLIAIGVISFVFFRVSEQEISVDSILNQLDTTSTISGLFLTGILLFTVLNWMLEIKKWQLLSGIVQSYSFAQTAFIALVGHAAAIITPLKAGEYTAKAYYADAGHRKKISFLTFYGNVQQMGATLIFGAIGCGIFTYYFYYEYLAYVVLAICALLAVLWGLKHVIWNIAAAFKHFSVDRIRLFLKTTPRNIKKNTLHLSLLRYLVFAHQFYFLLLIFQVELPYLLVMSGIFLTYLISSITPILSMFDIVLKVGIAISIFTFMGAEELAVLCATTLMWGLNFILPAIVGSILLGLFSITTTTLKTYP